jgi:NADH-quinone oxidoreductase subunit L
MALSLLLSVSAFWSLLTSQSSSARAVYNFRWFALGDNGVMLGWVLDPLSAVMIVMVCFVGLLIFIYSTGYMAQDDNYTRFFCFLSLFAAAMLGLVLSNSLLLLFVCWELVGLASYLLIGFWFYKPSAAAAAKKAFITTRVGDLGLLLGMVWLYAEAGMLLFYDGGAGCLEEAALSRMTVSMLSIGMSVSTAIGLLIFIGAAGKSGQVPLHVWLPDAMEGPTPVSALIHAATMVAAGVFLIARVYPLMAAGTSAALSVVTWVGAITAVFAASIAVSQTDLKRILAYSTVSQLGYMMLGLGTGGVAVGMFHLITHAFFKALLFLGAGSVIHASDNEQDIRRMGGLRRALPITFGTYAVGMLALSGFPLVFSGFWSKDAILHAARGWPVSQVPFWLGVLGAFLTAFYMTRQVVYVFFGQPRSEKGGHLPHESPRVMTMPLIVLAVCAVLLGFVGTPMWPWFQGFLSSSGPLNATHTAELATKSGETIGLMVASSLIVFAGIGLGWWLYAKRIPLEGHDPLEGYQPEIFTLLRRKYFVDEIYEWSFVRLTHAFGRACDWLDRFVWATAVQAVAFFVVGISWCNRLFDEYVINFFFDRACFQMKSSGRELSAPRTGQVQAYLRVLGLSAAVLALLLLIWGCRSS